MKRNIFFILLALVFQSVMYFSIYFFEKKEHKNLDIGDKRHYLCSRNQVMMPKATGEVTGAEWLVYRHFSDAIVLQDGVRRKSSKKTSKKLVKKFGVKNRSITFAPAFRTEDAR